jgi:hypothetical protein
LTGLAKARADPATEAMGTGGEAGGEHEEERRLGREEEKETLAGWVTEAKVSVCFIRGRRGIGRIEQGAGGGPQLDGVVG